MSILTTASDRSVRQEIIDLANTLADSQARLHQLVARLEEHDPETWQTRYAQLEKSHKEAVNSAKWLRAQNVDLEHKLEQHKPEMDNALSAREAAFRKLKHARKVIRDLLDERGDMESPRSRGSLTQEEIDEALYDEFHRDDDSSSTSSDSEKTVRLASIPPSQLNTPQPSRQIGPESPVSPALTHRTNATVKSGNSGSESFRSSVTSMHLSPQRPSPNNSPDTWSIHFKKPPGSSVLREGPISWEALQNSMSLDDDMMNSLHSLALSPDLSMRLQITRLPSMQNIACLYDPIFVETRHRSYILDWGRRQTNQNIERYISRHKGMNLVFHTFTFPMKESEWFYIGAHHWSVVELQAFWPLEGKSRDKIIKKLSERTRGEVDEAEMGRLLDSGELKQICVELTRVADAKVSIDFAQGVLGRTPLNTEPRHERRTEGVKE